MPHRFQTVVIVLAVLVTACASEPSINHIDPAARPHFKSVDTYLIVAQTDIYAETNKSNLSSPTAGGLILDIIEASVDDARTRNAAAIVQPICDSMEDYDYAKVLAEKIDAGLRNVDWLHTKNIQVLRSVDKDLYLEKCIESKASAILFIIGKYWISPGFNDVYTNAKVIMFPNSEVLKQYRAKLDRNDNLVNFNDNIYHNAFIMKAPLKVEGLKKDRGWILSRNGAVKVKSALEECAQSISNLISRDLEREDVSENKGKAVIQN